jgi:bifunctional DNA-binding transcriptional regulator/antitoxin component of YhaV-PrlF toxin-antitoxin module
MQTLAEKIGQNGEIKLPQPALEALGVKIGEEVILAIKDRAVLIKSAQSLTATITDSIKLNDPKLIEEVVESEEWL